MHGEHSDAPPSAKKPARQATHAKEPEPLAAMPLGQGTQEDCPEAL